MIIPVGEQVIHQACLQCAQWHRQGYDVLRVSINLSAKQFGHHNLVATIKDALNKSGLAAQFLELEITESILAQDMDHAILVLNELRDMGVYLAIDDFGTGYSSLSYLMHFPVHYLKIDQTFIRDVRTNPDHANLTRAIIAIADSLGLETVAEGVETSEQLSFVTESQCDEIQGFYFSKALPADQFIPVIEQINRQN
jgi:EAL domain-containing protein (putative c-di-GMP-specific phosphodiesterase class I)